MPKERCEKQLDVRGADDDYYDDEPSPTCDNDSQICCHENRIIINLCADHSSIGFR